MGMDVGEQLKDADLGMLVGDFRMGAVEVNMHVRKERSEDKGKMHSQGRSNSEVGMAEVMEVHAEVDVEVVLASVLGMISEEGENGKEQRLMERDWRRVDKDNSLKEKF